jgi:hypothetical protein
MSGITVLFQMPDHSLETYDLEDHMKMSDVRSTTMIIHCRGKDKFLVVKTRGLARELRDLIIALVHAHRKMRRCGSDTQIYLSVKACEAMGSKASYEDAKKKAAEMRKKDYKSDKHMRNGTEICSCKRQKCPKCEGMYCKEEFYEHKIRCMGPGDLQWA